VQVFKGELFFEEEEDFVQAEFGTNIALFSFFPDHRASIPKGKLTIITIT